MLATILRGQFVGSNIEHVVFLLGGAYIAFLWPRRVERQVASEKITRKEGDARLKKLRPWFGYLLIAWSVCGFVYDCYLYFWWNIPQLY
ncbi:MAG: hypothetical protein ACREIW_15945 [Chthoniobacterales bacterium]